MTFDPTAIVAEELELPSSSVSAVLKLLEEGNTIPFIARYRKEMTGDLDEIQIRAIEERGAYLVELDKRRQAILASIEEQGKLTQELKKRIEAAETKSTLEDLYAPYKQKRRTRAIIAKEKGLEPLAVRILEQPGDGDPTTEAAEFVDDEKGVEDVEAALKGARDIVAEVISDNADIRTMVRATFAKDGLLVSAAAPKQEQGADKFKDYFDYKEPVTTIPSHRYLAVRRGEREGALRCSIAINVEKTVDGIVGMMNQNPSSPFSDELEKAAVDGYNRLLSTTVETDLRADLKMSADRAAVDVFAGNLRSLLLGAPYGTKSVIGVDPGLRTGCKCAALDATGKFLGNMTFNLVHGDAGTERSRAEFAAFAKRFSPTAIAVGNGTGGRETEKFVRETLAKNDMKDVIVVSVSESGASVYSASELAGKEFPELDLTVRGAISIARRLQDPLAELVKIEPKSIGVGQYQHDVHQPLLGRKLEEVVESCVNHVGVELNTASAPLLSHVAGIGPKLAGNIVEHREGNGAFKKRRELLKVAKLGPKAFEQSAGFLRIRGGAHPLDASAVHPERYALVERIAKEIGVELGELVGNEEAVKRVDTSKYVGEEVGELTLKDILAELAKPGRDPRDTFDPPVFREDVQTMDDLTEGMELEGIVTNVTAFGAFVDVGVHQDGLVHISQLADRFVRDPAEVVKAGDKIKVRVLEVDLGRKRISLTAKSGAPQQQDNRNRPQQNRPQGGSRPPRPQRPAPEKFSNNPFADLLKK